MTVKFELPTDLEADIRRKIGGDLDAYAREALAVQMYRDRMLTHAQFRRFLGVEDYEADTILKKHGGVDELSAEELAEQVRESQNLRRKR